MQIPPHGVVSSQRLICIVLVCLFGGAAPGYSQPAGLVAFNGDTQVGYCLAASPDGKFIYSGGAYTIAVFNRQPDGTLLVKEVLNNCNGEISGINYIVDLTISPDGRNLYAASLDLDKHSILTFERDTESGTMKLVDTLDFPGIDLYSFDFSHNLFVSPDGKKLYWFFRDQRFYSKGAFMLFARDAVTGRLTVLQTLHDNDSQFGGFKIPAALAATPDGKHLYGVGRNDEWLLILSHDSSTGRIRLTDTFKTDLQLRAYTLRGSIDVSPNGLFVYAVFRYSNGQGKVYVFKRNFESGSLTPVNSTVPEIPDFLQVSPEGSHLYATQVSRVFTYSIDLSSGAIKFMDQFDCQCSADPYGFAFPADGKNIYFKRYENGVASFTREVQTGNLFLLENYDKNFGGTDRLSGGRAVEVSPQGGHLYVGTDSDAALNVFARDQARGRLTLVEADSVGQISSMKISPRGEHLYATTQKNELKTFAVNPSTGAINLVQTLTDTVRQYHTLAFSPDGQQLYLADYKRVKVFARDPISGSLSGVQSFIRNGLWENRAVALEVSPEGKHVYWQSGDEISTLVRDATNGKLAYSDSLRMSLRDYEHVLGHRALQISADGKHVYAGVTAYRYFDDGDHFAHPKVLSFERNAQSGALTLVEVVASHKWQRWDLMRDLALSADGKELYAVLDSEGDSYAGLAMLTRDVETGKLTQRDFFEVIKGGLGYDGLLTDAALSPDGGFMYFTDQIGVTTFATGRRIISRVHDNNVFSAAPPRVLNLAQNYPNPFALAAQPRATVIHYEIAANDGAALPVELAIYNLQGQHVVTLVRQTQARGKYSAEWSGLNARGAIVPAGIYFYRLKAGEHVMTKKLVVR